MKQQQIAVGTTWIRKQRFVNPWEPDPTPVKILEIKEGWVRFERESGGVGTHRLDAFLEIYEPVSEWPVEIEV